jgi:hypothetical protein
MPAESAASEPTLPPFRERAPWFGGDLQTLRNIIWGGPPELLGGERLLLALPDGDRLAARFDQPGTVAGAPFKHAPCAPSPGLSFSARVGLSQNGSPRDRPPATIAHPLAQGET